MTQFVEQLRNQAKWYAQPGHNARDLMDSRLLEKAADEIECLRAKVERMGRDLRMIAETDPVDAALDPQRAIRIARAALEESK